MTALPRLYAIADASFGDPVRLAEALFAGGARLIQVRNKTGSSRELHGQVEAILRMAPSDARVIVNDRADVAMITNASGVHLGQSDLPVHAARGILGESALIGLSTHSLEQALDADRESVDYIAVGPIFPTQTKANPDRVLGLSTLRTICSSVAKPVVAIGGIRLEMIRDIFDCGAASIAVISDLLCSSDVAERTKVWVRSV